MWRAADKGLWKHIAGSGYKFEAEVYWKILLEEAEALQQPVGSAFQRASKISLISGTAIAKDSKTLELFLCGDFGEEGLTDVAMVTVSEKRYTILVRLRKEHLATTTPPIKMKAKTASPQVREIGDVDQCGSHLGQLLNAVKKNGTLLKCINVTECKYCGLQRGLGRWYWNWWTRWASGGQEKEGVGGDNLC